MANKYGIETGKVLLKNFIGDANPDEDRKEILESPKLLSQENTTIKTDIDTDLSVSDSVIKGSFGYKDLRFWYGSYSNNQKSFIAITNTKDELLTTTTDKKVITQIDIQNQLVDIPLIKYLNITDNGDIYGLWNYNSKIHFFRLVPFIDQIGNPSLVKVFPIVNIDVETEVIEQDKIKQGSAKFANYDLIDITQDETTVGLYSFVLWKDNGALDRKMVFILLDTSDVTDIKWLKNEDINPSHVDESLGTDFNGVSSLAIKINKTKFESAQKNDDNKILGSVWFATKSGSVTTTPKDLTVKNNKKENKIIVFNDFDDRFEGKKTFTTKNYTKNEIEKINKIKTNPTTTNFKFNKMNLKSSINYQTIEGKVYMLPVDINITDQNIINELLLPDEPLEYIISAHWSEVIIGITPVRTLEVDSIILKKGSFQKELLQNNQTIDMSGNSFYSPKLSIETEFVFDYSYTKNIIANSINTASQILISARDDKKQNTLYYDLAQNISNPIFNSNKPIPFNYLNAYYPVYTKETWQVWDFDGTRGVDYETPSKAKQVNDNSLWPDGTLALSSIKDENYGISIVGVASDASTGALGGSLGFNIYDGQGNGKFLDVSETLNNEFQNVSHIVGNRQENLMFWSAYNNDFSKKINYMQVYANSISPYVFLPYDDYFKTTIIDRISVRKGSDFKNTRFDRAITNANVSNNILSVSTNVEVEDLNDNDNDKLILSSRVNRSVLTIDTSNYQNKTRQEGIEINVSTKFRYLINGVDQPTPSVALARLHYLVKQTDLDHLQIEKGVITFDDDTTKEFSPLQDATWEVVENPSTQKPELTIKFGLRQTDTNKKATNIKILSKKGDMLGEIDLTTKECSQEDWTNKILKCYFIINII